MKNTPMHDSPDLIDHLRAEWRTERPSLDTSAMEVVGRLLVLGEVLRRRVEAVLAPFELGYSEFGVLATLRRSGPPFEHRPGTLQTTVLLGSGSMTACLDRLERRGLIERRPDPDDRRARLVRLLPSGEVLLADAMEARMAEAERFLAPLSSDHREALAPLLRILVHSHRPLP